jgi:hypothetical protein
MTLGSHSVAVMGSKALLPIRKHTRRRCRAPASHDRTATVRERMASRTTATPSLPFQLSLHISFRTVSKRVLVCPFTNGVEAGSASCGTAPRLSYSANLWARSVCTSFAHCLKKSSMKVEPADDNISSNERRCAVAWRHMSIMVLMMLRSSAPIRQSASWANANCNGHPCDSEDWEAVR